MAKKATKAQLASATCDYCNRELGCLHDSVRAREYWGGQGLLSFRACDDCLPTVMDDFPDLHGDTRLWALRLLHARGVNLPRIDQTIEAARGIVIPQQLAELRRQREDIFELRHEGELVAAVWAAQALWSAANHLKDSMDTRHARRAGEKVIAGGKKSAERRRHTGPAIDSKKTRIINAALSYKGTDSAKIATLVRKTLATRQYVGRVLREIGKSNS